MSMPSFSSSAGIRQPMVTLRIKPMIVVITPDTGDTCTVTMTAQLAGPAGSLVEHAVAPLSGYGQRRRLERLGALAEYVHRWAGVRESPV